jgi:hypothetical protein
LAALAEGDSAEVWVIVIPTGKETVMPRRRSRIPLVTGWVAAVLVWAGSGLSAFGQATWDPAPAPVLIGNCITVGGFCRPGGSTFTIVAGATVTLSATSQDNDTVTDATGVHVVPDPGLNPQVVWSCSAGFLSSPRVNSGTNIIWTAPGLDVGQNIRNETVTAQPDDDTTAAPGNRPAGDLGNCDDNPGAGVTINFRVVRGCPTTLVVGTTCNLPPGTAATPTTFATYWAQNYRTWGYLASGMDVGGGTPPNPPGNWNGLLIMEVVTLHPTNPGNAVAADFNGNYTPAQACMGSGTFVVGNAGGGTAPCAGAQANNRFWDFHWTNWNQCLLVPGALANRTVNCQQTYYCNNNQLPANGTFIITRTFTRNMWTPPAPPGAAAVAVTEITVTKAAE